MSVLFLPEIQEYFDELEIILYEKGYFSYQCFNLKEFLEIEI
jgi:hypothetical protein